MTGHPRHFIYIQDAGLAGKRKEASNPLKEFYVPRGWVGQPDLIYFQLRVKQSCQQSLALVATFGSR